MDLCRQRGKVWILSANDDSRVSRVDAVQTDEVLAVESNHGASLSRCVTQYVFIGDTLIGVSSLVRCQHIVPKCPERLNRSEGKILVGIKSRNHESSPLAVISRSISARCARA